MDNLKQSQETKRRKGEGDWALPPLDDARLPPAAAARQRFVQAMDAWDEEAADVAVTALARTASPAELRALMVHYRARDFPDLGPQAIQAAHAWPAPHTLGTRAP